MTQDILKGHAEIMKEFERLLRKAHEPPAPDLDPNLPELTDREFWDLGRYQLDELVDTTDSTDDILATVLFREAGRFRRRSALMEAVINQHVTGWATPGMSRGLVDHRDPEWHRRAYESLTVQPDAAWAWHQDGYGAPEYIALWSDVLPTEVRRKDDKTLVETEPGHLYLVYNPVHEHRGPLALLEGPPPDRNFLRYYVESTTYTY